MGYGLNNDTVNPDEKHKVSYCSDYSRLSFTMLGAFVEAMNGETYVPMIDYDEEEEE